MWDWEWVHCSKDDDDCVVDLSQDEHDEDKCDEDAHDESESHDSDSEDIPNITHSVIFKCIGATKEHHYQELLGLEEKCR